MEDPELDRLQSILNRIQLKGTLLLMECYFGPLVVGIKSIQLSILCWTKDARAEYGPDDPITIVLSEEYSRKELRLDPEAKIVRKIRHQILELLKHELNEGMQLDHKFIIEPH